MHPFLKFDWIHSKIKIFHDILLTPLTEGISFYPLLFLNIDRFDIYTN